VRTSRDDYSWRRHLTMNSNLGLILAWLVRDVDRFLGGSSRTKVREEHTGLTLLLSFRLGINRGGRSGSECRRATFGASVRFGRLRQENEKRMT
jgi:hypothetical protein